jgi:hypothetical protein
MSLPLRRSLFFGLLGVALATLIGSLHLAPGGGESPAALPDPGLVDRARAADREASGAALWRGDWALTARLSGHEQVLPGQASRCINCHGAADRAAPGGGPRLDAGYLTHSVARRGGPASRYDEAAFCRLLRTGIDPAAVMVPREMPRYDIDDADCAALWQFINRAPVVAPAVH